MPEPRGKVVQMTCWADSDHAGNVGTRCSRTGVLIFCNHSPFVFHSKKQGSIEMSSFGSKFMAMKTAIKLVEGLCFKLRMMGCPLDGATCVLTDNMSVVHNCTKPELALKKKSCSMAFHFCRERIAVKVVFVVWTKMEDNLADMLTKPQPLFSLAESHRDFARRILRAPLLFWYRRPKHNNTKITITNRP